MHVQQLPVSLSRTPGTPGPGKGQRFIDAAAAARGCPGYPPSRHSDKMSKVRTAPVALRRRRGPPAAATAGDSRRTVSEHRAPAEASSRRYPICFWSTCRSGNVEISAALPPSKHQAAKFPAAAGLPAALTSAYEPTCVRRQTSHLAIYRALRTYCRWWPLDRTGRPLCPHPAFTPGRPARTPLARSFWPKRRPAR